MANAVGVMYIRVVRTGILRQWIIHRQPALQGALRHRPQEDGMSSVVFTLLFGMLSGIAGFVGRAPCFEIVLGLGLLGLAHLSLVAARRADPPLLGKRVER